MIDIKSYNDHTEQLFAVYKELILKSIDDFDIEPEPRLNGREFFTYFTQVTGARQSIYPFDKSKFKMYDDFVVLSGDIKFCVGMLHYLYPHTSTNPDEFTSTLIDRRYIMHVSFGVQSIYHFWDRIGDLLWLYFPTKIDEKKVYTGGVINCIPENYKISDTFTGLKKSYESLQQTFRSRHDIVHKCSLGTELYWERLSSHGNKRKQNRMLVKARNYRDNMTKSLPQCIEALYLALELILLLPEKSKSS